MNVLTTATDARAMAVAAGIPSSRTSPEDCRVKSPDEAEGSTTPAGLLTSIPSNRVERSSDQTYQAVRAVATPRRGPRRAIPSPRKGRFRAARGGRALARAATAVATAKRSSSSVAFGVSSPRHAAPKSSIWVWYASRNRSRQSAGNARRRLRGEHGDLTRHGSLGEEDRAVRPDHLAADVHPDPGRTREVRGGNGAFQADRDVRVIEVRVAEHRAVHEREHGVGVLPEQPTGGVEIVHADVHDEAAGCEIVLAGREVLTARQLHGERLADRARRDQSRELAERAVVSSHVGDPRHELGVRERLIADARLLGQRDRAGLLEQQVLARSQHRDGEICVLAGPGADEDRLDPIARDELVDGQELDCRISAPTRSRLARPRADAIATSSTAGLRSAHAACTAEMNPVPAMPSRTGSSRVSTPVLRSRWSVPRRYQNLAGSSGTTGQTPPDYTVFSA